MARAPVEILLAGVPAVRLIDAGEGHAPEGRWPNASTPEEEAARTHAAVATSGVFLLVFRLMVALRGGRLAFVLEEEVILSFIQVCASSESGRSKWKVDRTSSGSLTEFRARATVLLRRNQYKST